MPASDSSFPSIPNINVSDVNVQKILQAMKERIDKLSTDVSSIKTKLAI